MVRRVAAGRARRHCGPTMAAHSSPSCEQADKSGARFAVIIGAEEMASGVVTLRPLRDGGEQQTVRRHDIVATLCELKSEG